MRSVLFCCQALLPDDYPHRRLLTLLLGLSTLWCCTAPRGTQSSGAGQPAGPTDWTLDGWVKPADNPILQPTDTLVFDDPVSDTRLSWAAADLFNPGAIAKGDSVYLFFRAEDDAAAELGYRTSRVGLAVSADGLHFRADARPVLYPDPEDEQASFEVPGGCEDPRVVLLPDGRYLMLYTAWNREVARLSAATSTDLRHWTKHGPVFAEAFEGRFLDLWTKSGSVVCEPNEQQTLQAVHIQGRYWMYWGDAVVGIAHSEDGLQWTPVLDHNDELLDPLPTRKGHFDSNLSEPGPPALLTEQGILLLYNGRNDPTDSLRAQHLPAKTYCTGQALFAAHDPTQLLARTTEPFLCPTLPHERTGQYAGGTTFAQALVRFRDRWWLYYGTADSMVGVAVAP